jgi:hypothetical protein
MSFLNNPAFLVADWWVDPIHGDDNNSGKTPAHPVKTVMDGVVSRWKTLQPLLRQTTTIHLMNPQPPGHEAIALMPILTGACAFIIKSELNPKPFGLGNVVAKVYGNPGTLLIVGGAAGLSAGQIIFNTTAGKSSRATISTIGQQIIGSADISNAALYGPTGMLNGQTLSLAIDSAPATVLTLQGTSTSASATAMFAAIQTTWPGLLSVGAGGSAGKELAITAQVSIEVAGGTAVSALGLAAPTTDTVAVMMQPQAALTPGSVWWPPLSPAEVETWAAGDTAEVFTPATLNLQVLSVSGGSDVVALTGASCWLDKIHVLDPSGVPGTSTFTPTYTDGSMILNDCVIDPFLASPTGLGQFVNTWLRGACGDPGITFTMMGGQIGDRNGDGALLGNLTLDNDVIVATSASLAGTVLKRAYFLDVSGFNQTVHFISPGNNVYMIDSAAGGPRVWGGGTIETGGSASFSKSSSTSWADSLFCTPSLGGGGANFVTAYTEVSNVGQWTGGIALTAANLDAQESKGLQNPAIGSIFGVSS